MDNLLVTRNARFETNRVYHRFHGSQQRAACGTPYYRSRDALLPAETVLTVRMWRPCQRAGCFPNAPIQNFTGPVGVRSAHKAHLSNNVG